MKKHYACLEPAILLILVCGLFALSFHSFLLFHTLVELFSIAVAWCIFMIAWNTRSFVKNAYFLTIGVAFLWIGGLDLLHTLSYKGMGLFPGDDANLPTQIWIAARYLESLALLAALGLMNRQPKAEILMSVFGAVSTAAAAAVLGGVFPDCYVEGVGLTSFKVVSEYLICLILLATAGLLWRRRAAFDPSVFRLLSASIGLTIGAELAFTFYVSVYGLSNLIGHFFKLASFYLIYLGLIETGLRKPFSILFRDLKLSQAALQESEGQFRRMFETHDAVMLLVDPITGAIIRANKAAERFYGHTAEAFANTSIFQINQLPRSDVLREMAAAMSEERNLFWFQHRLADGRVRDVEIHSSPITFHRERLLFSIVHDITERMRAEQKLKDSIINLELAQRIAHVGNWSLDPAVGVPAWSDQVYQIYERDPALGPPPVDDYKKIYAPDQYLIFRDAIQTAIAEGKPYDINLKLALPGGQQKWIHAICEPDPEPGPAGHFLRGTIQDITEMKRAEDQLQEYSERLEEMVAERTRELKNAQAELLLKERLAVLGHFAGSVSHELRNPLGAIDASAYFLDMKLSGGNEKTKEHLGRIRSNVKKSTAIIESLLNLSRMEPPKTGRIDLADFLPEALKTAKIPPAVETALDLPEAPVSVDIDPEQIRMALKNIVTNAVQAMGGAGALTIAAGPSTSGNVEISVADTGPGITPDTIEKVFEPLFSTKTHGIGFGLSITKMIVENHGGAIRAESPPDGGACFVITLPQDKLVLAQHD